MKPNTKHSDQISIELMGEQYKLIGDISQNYALLVSSYLEEKLQELREVSPRMGEQQLVLLTAMNIVDELFQAHQEMDELPRKMYELKRIGKKTDDLISALEERIIGRDQEPLD